MIGETTASTSKNYSCACSSGLYGWYAVCTSKHLRSDKIYFLSLFNEPLALYRDKGNKAVCIKDYCPHRGASFRGGEVKRNEIICPYHGARFSSNQTCSKHPKLNCQHIIDLRYNNYARNIYLLQYPCVEKDDYIYIYYTGKSKSNLEEFEIKNPLDVLLPESRGFKSLDYCYEEAFLDFKCD